MRDLEDNKIIFSQIPNSHILILGKSGMGKTFFLCRKMEEDIYKGYQVVIFDYSGSYTKEELVKNKFQYLDKLRVSNPINGSVDFKFVNNHLSSNIANALFKIIIKRGYYQKKLLKEAVNVIFKNNKKFSFPNLIRILELLRDLKEEEEEKKNILHLLSKFDVYSELENILISPCGESDIVEPGIWIIQLSDYAEIQRKFCVEFLAELFWQDVCTGKKGGSIFIFDEFQNIDLKPGGALSAMLREGRKYELSVWLASQFLGNYGREAVDTLMQVGHKMFFRPTENDEKIIADFINPHESKIWTKILGKLSVGEAILKGSYFINNGTKEVETPIICKIESNGGGILKNQ